ncbi:3-oxoacyl-[acyl-carrier protein] reductase [Halopseudomonas xinjiangensis]|uniref:2,3-dihydroxy-2,3-dihydro-p-cumate dehydrogenase n=1 Tax=Halopseudomonas xinjiangensis TaxID=487184 RepID=A0A1H1YA63_9GAMM|nr:SDR family oxidoreductase [Halopseudomonas xinjiangensis]SDT18428.1 3-oxoacyl-[acyl-carrier protein] reductase [Halopseudomonas xinjiangensis]
MSTQSSLAGQRILVTGAATGIGRACVEALAGRGARVWAGHQAGQEPLMDELIRSMAAQGGTVLAVEADVADAASVDAMFASIAKDGPLYGLVNNAGVILEKPFLQTDERDWRQVMSVDLDGVYRCCRIALQGMAAQGGGSIVNVTSDLGFLGREEYVAYCAAKAGVIGLTRALAREFAPHIPINGVAPGPIETAMVSPANMSAEWIAREVAIPAGRLGQPAEVAAAVCFLLSSEASFFTGQILGPNGGSWMGG